MRNVFAIVLAMALLGNVALAQGMAGGPAPTDKNTTDMNETGGMGAGLGENMTGGLNASLGGMNASMGDMNATGTDTMGGTGM